MHVTQRRFLPCRKTRFCLAMHMVFGLIVCCFLLGACSSKDAPTEDPAAAKKESDTSAKEIGLLPPPVPVEDPSKITWGFMPGAIEVELVARNNLNTVREKKHAVLIKFLQLEKKEAVEALAKTSAGIVSLLEGDGKDVGVIQSDTHYIQPNAALQLQLDKEDKVKYFAVVAGFDSLNPEDCFAITPMPVRTTTEKEWLVLEKTLYEPAQLIAKIFLIKNKVEMKGFERVRK